MRDSLREVLDGTASANNPHNRNRGTAMLKRREAQRAQLLVDGRTALRMIKTKPIADVLLVVGGSRARVYRAMDVAACENALPGGDIPGHKETDPLLL